MTARDEGVSSVVAAVLLVALFTTAMTVWTFTTLPTWVAERESNHQAEAQEAFGQLKADLESLVAQDAPGPAATSVDLGPSKVPLLQAGAARGTLSYQDGFSLQASFTGALLHLQDGVAVGLPDEPAGGAPLVDVASMQAFSLGLTSSGVTGSGQEAWVQAAIFDGTDTVTGRLVHQSDASPSGCRDSGIVLEVTSPLSTRSTPLLCEVDTAITDYAIDLLGQPTFAAALRELDGTLTITVTDGETGATVAGVYAAVWTDISGIDHATGAGAASSYAVDEDGGRIVLDPNYQRFASQSLVYEGGAVIAAQGGGQAMRSGPGFELGTDGGVGSVRWTIVDLAGSGSRSGSDAVTASVRNDGSSDLLLEVTGATFTVTSEYAAAWRQLFADTVLLSGASSAVASAGGSGDTATLTLGVGTGVSSWVVRLHVVDATITVG